MLCENRHPYHSYHSLKRWDIAERQPNKKEGTGFVPTSLLHRRSVRFCVCTRLLRGFYLILRRKACVPWWRCYSPADSLIGTRSRSRLWRWQAESHPPSHFSSGHTHTHTHAPLHLPTRSCSWMLICEIHAHIHLFYPGQHTLWDPQFQCAKINPVVWTGTFCAHVWNACCDLVCIWVAKCHSVHVNHKGRGSVTRRRGQSSSAGESRH